MSFDPDEQDQDQNRRQMLAFALFVGAFLLVNQLFFPPRPAPAPADPSPAQAATPGAAPTPAPAAASISQADPASVASAPQTAPDRSIPVKWGGGLSATFRSLGASPTSLLVPEYHAHVDAPWIPSWLWSRVTGGEAAPFSLTCADPGAADLVLDPSAVVLPVGTDAAGIAADIGTYDLVEKDDGRTLEFSAPRGPFTVTKRYAIPQDGHLLGYTVEIRNTSSAATELRPSFGVADHAKTPDDQYAPARTVAGEVDGDVESLTPEDAITEPETWNGDVRWVAMSDKYFLLGLEAEAPLTGTLSLQGAPGTERAAAVLNLPPVTLQPGETKQWTWKLYAGPKNLDRLKENKLELATSVDFGMFGLVALPLLWGLKKFYAMTASWGVSIILLTVLVKIALFNLNQKSFRSMKAMQKLQPEIKALQEKYGEDREALNRETMALWQKHGVNPAGGCMPILLQMPVWFAMYQVLWAAVELYQSHFLYFCDLSQRDPIGIFPLLLGISMIVQQRMTPTPGADPLQVKMMQYMTIFFAIIMFTMPAGLSVYMLVNNVLSIAQQQYIQRTHDDDGKPKKAAGRKA